MRNFEIEQIIFKIGLEQLEHKNGKFHFRCPICGDSAHSTRKRRGWILERNGNYQYHCFNCSYSNSLANFLKQYHYELYKEYLSIILFKKSNNIPEPQKNNYVIKEYERLELPSINTLNEEHKAKIYIRNRKIPFRYWNDIYYTDSYKKFVNTLICKFEDLSFDDERIVIPIYNIHKKIVGVQGRSLIPKAKIRYLTILFNENDLNICGLDRVDKNKTIYITEGFFDSLFLDNAITMNSSNVPLNRLNEIASKDKFVFVFDNERRNKQILNRMLKVVDNGYRICVWPDGIKGKDINEMILNNKTSDDIMKIINDNTFSGFNAKIRIKTIHV